MMSSFDAAGNRARQPWHWPSRDARCGRFRNAVPHRAQSGEVHIDSIQILIRPISSAVSSSRVRS
jgi:hypothetical protein